MDDRIVSLSHELIDAVKTGRVRDRDELQNLKLKLCKKYRLEAVPPNSDILANVDPSDVKVLTPFLIKKPMRTMSGVAVVAVMTSPFDCPHGKCAYCPGGVQNGSPQSYTGKEPAARRAGRNEFDPYRQVLDRITQLTEIGHKTDKIDRIRLFLLTNAVISLDYEKSPIELENSTVCEYYVWDARRIMQQDNIISGRSPIVVDFEGDYNCTLPCVKMPDVSDKVSCYLCIIPGIVLSQVYNKFHQQILEMNVRTFLQFKGASNKGIRNTLIGHKATAAEVRKGLADVQAEPTCSLLITMASLQLPQMWS